jgi:hypothetical protein
MAEFMNDISFLLLLAAGMGLGYLALLYLFTYFFTGRLPTLGPRSFYTALGVVVLSLAGYGVSFSYPDPEIGNRILHAFGGGFLAFLMCFLVWRETKLPITIFQFTVFSALIVTAMGVGNEMLEFFLQNYRDLLFARDPNDTWLDLISNTVGLAIAAGLLLPFMWWGQGVRAKSV